MKTKAIKAFVSATLACTCMLSSVPMYTAYAATAPEDYHLQYCTPMPSSYFEAEQFYYEKGEISYCDCTRVMTCIPVADVWGDLQVTYKLNGEEFTPSNVQRIFEPFDGNISGSDDEDVVYDIKETTCRGYEVMSFTPSEFNKNYTLEINVSYGVVANAPNYVTVMNESYTFDFYVNSSGEISDPCLNPTSYNQCNIFQKTYGNYTAYEDKVLVCYDVFQDGGYQLVIDDSDKNSAPLLEQKDFISPLYLVDENGAVQYIDGQGQKSFLTFDASQEGTYTVKLGNQRNWEGEVYDTLEFTYNVDSYGNITFPKVSKLQVPDDYESAKNFIEQYGESETDGKQVITVIPVVNSEDFSMEYLTETNEIKPYDTETVTYYFPPPGSVVDTTGSDGAKGYQVTVYTMYDELGDISYPTSLLQTIKTTFSGDTYGMGDIVETYTFNYKIDLKTATFSEASVTPTTLAETDVFNRKYGNFAVNQSQHEIIAVVPYFYTTEFELDIQPERNINDGLPDTYECYQEYYTISDDGQLIGIDGLGGNQVISIRNINEPGEYSLKLKRFIFGSSSPSSEYDIYYNIDYTVTEDGTIILGETNFDAPTETDFAPTDYESARVFYNTYGTHETNGQQVVEVIPISSSEDFSITFNDVAPVEFPYTSEVNYYYYDESAEVSGGYCVVTYTIKDNPEYYPLLSLQRTTTTTYTYDDAVYNDLYKIDYIVDAETLTFKENSIVPTNHKEANRFAVKYNGNFAVDENKKQIVAVVHANDEVWKVDGCFGIPFVQHEVYGTATMTSSTEIYRGYYMLNDGSMVDVHDSGTKVMTFDASEPGEYTIRIKMTLMDDPYYYNIDYTVAEDGTITMGEQFDFPDSSCIMEGEEVNYIYENCEGYTIKDGVITIVLPLEYDISAYELNYDNIQNEALTDVSEYTYNGKKYAVYTHDLNQILTVYPTTGDGCVDVSLMPDGEFSMTYTVYSPCDVVPPIVDYFYTYRFNAENGVIKNTAVVTENSGDANGDGIVSIADAVTVSAYVSNSSKNNILYKQRLYSDVQNHGNGLNASDALMIQQYVTGIIKSF